MVLRVPLGQQVYPGCSGNFGFEGTLLEVWVPTSWASSMAKDRSGSKLFARAVERQFRDHYSPAYTIIPGQPAVETKGLQSKHHLTRLESTINCTEYLHHFKLSNDDC